MLIGIDGNEANESNRVGVGRYAIEVLRSLYANYELRITNYESTRFVTYLKNPPVADLPKSTDWWQYKIVGPSPMWTQIGLPLHLYSASPRTNVFFTPTHYAPRFSPVPTVISIMDLSFIHFPEMFTAKDLHQLTSWTAYSVKKAKKILTISNFTKVDIIKTYHRDPEDVIVTYPGYDRKKFRISNFEFRIKKIKEKYKISDNYVLYVGTLQPRKNIIRLIQAFRQVLIQSKEKNFQLVIAGKKGWMYEQIFVEVKKQDLENQVIFLDYVNDEDLPLLYQAARCFVLPSLYEGFGLTVVEALASGVPVIVSNTSCLPEIVGNAGVYIDPYSVESIVAGIIKVLRWSKERRDRQIQTGFERIKKFDWKTCARQTLKVLTAAGQRYV